MEQQAHIVYAEFYQAATYVLGGACTLIIAAIGIIYNGIAKRITVIENQVFTLLTETLPKEYAKKQDIERSLDALHQTMREWRAEQKEQYQELARAVSSKQDKAH